MKFAIWYYSLKKWKVVAYGECHSNSNNIKNHIKYDNTYSLEVIKYTHGHPDCFKPKTFVPEEKNMLEFAICKYSLKYWKVIEKCHNTSNNIKHYM